MPKRPAVDTASGAKAPKAAKPAKPSGPILQVAKGLAVLWRSRKEMRKGATGRTTEKETLASRLLTDFQNHAGGPSEDLVKRIEAMGANESMVMALPAMLSKPASERGSFDAMVFTSVQEWLELRIAAVDEAIQNTEPTKAANADALSNADITLQETREQQLDGADAYRQIRSDEEVLEDEVRLLRQSIRKLREASRKHQAMSTRAQLALTTFQSGPKSAFELLRDRIEEVVPVGDVEQAGDMAEGADQEAAVEIEGAGADVAEAPSVS